MYEMAPRWGRAAEGRSWSLLPLPEIASRNGTTDSLGAHGRPEPSRTQFQIKSIVCLVRYLNQNDMAVPTCK